MKILNQKLKFKRSVYKLGILVKKGVLYYMNSSKLNYFFLIIKVI